MQVGSVVGQSVSVTQLSPPMLALSVSAQICARLPPAAKRTAQIGQVPQASFGQTDRHAPP